jgi:hypothetical protein
MLKHRCDGPWARQKKKSKKKTMLTSFFSTKIKSLFPETSGNGGLDKSMGFILAVMISA